MRSIIFFYKNFNLEIDVKIDNFAKIFNLNDYIKKAILTYNC